MLRRLSEVPMRQLMFFAPFVFVIGCPNAEPPSQREPVDVRPKVPAPPAAAEGVQFVMPDTVYKSGEDKQVCWVPDWTPDQDYLIPNFVGMQGKHGHHLISFRSVTPRTPGEVFDCTSAE